jgi:hypothetical protein
MAKITFNRAHMEVLVMLRTLSYYLVKEVSTMAEIAPSLNWKGGFDKH